MRKRGAGCGRMRRVRRRRRGVCGVGGGGGGGGVCAGVRARSRTCVCLCLAGRQQRPILARPLRDLWPPLRAHTNTRTRARARTQRTPAGDHACWPIIVPSTPLSLVKGRVEGGGGWKVTVRAGTAPAHASPRHVFPGPANILCARDMHGTHASVLPPIA